MNFCRFYNMTMNFILRIENKVPVPEDLNDSESDDRKNKSEINIFLGIFYILLSLIGLTFVLIISFAYITGSSLSKIIHIAYSLTTSRCDKK